jgi:hypothetical protein
MNTKTLLTVGAVAVLGVLAYNYFNKNKGTESLGMDGYSNLVDSTKGCFICNGSNGGYYAINNRCKSGDKCRR